MSEAVAVEGSSGGTGRWRRVFFGPHGLRAGWSLLIYVAATNAIAGALFLIITLFWKVPKHPPWTPQLLIVGESIQLVIALGVTLLMARIERRTLTTYGLAPRQAFRGRFWEGALWGVGSAALVYGLLAAAGGYTVRGLALHGTGALLWPLLWALAFLVAGLYEEVAYRGFQLFTASRGLGFWPAALLLSLAFGALHYFQKDNETWLGFLNVALIGVFFCFSVRRTGDIWFAVGWHFTFNFVSMGICGSPNTGNEGGKPLAGHLLDGAFSGPDWLTGGVTGAEASIFTLAMAVVLFALFHWRYREARYPTPRA
jgi:membrane protease YdiL (CAAX protease family)